MPPRAPTSAARCLCPEEVSEEDQTRRSRARRAHRPTRKWRQRLPWNIGETRTPHKKGTREERNRRTECATRTPLLVLKFAYCLEQSRAHSDIRLKNGAGILLMIH